MFTLKERKAKEPLFIKNEVGNKFATKDISNEVISYSSVNTLAIDLVFKKLTIPNHLDNVVVSKLDFVEIKNKQQISSITENQDLTSNLKLVSIPLIGSFSINVVSKGRRSRLYFTDNRKKPSITDPELDTLSVIKVPCDIAAHVHLDDYITACDDKYAKIYHNESYKIVDFANVYKLNENINNIDTEKYTYFIAKSI